MSALDTLAGSAKALFEKAGQFYRFSQGVFSSPSGTMQQPEQAEGQSMAFTFGEPVSAIGNGTFDYLGLVENTYNGYYVPPVNLLGLARTLRANAHHGSIIYFKRNILAAWFKPSSALGKKDFRRAALDYHVFGMCYFKAVRNVFGQVIKLEHRPALMIRKSIRKPDVFIELKKYFDSYDFVEYQPGEIIQIKNDDPEQWIYGVPEWYGGLQSILLSQDVTLFRRRYFLNGAHVGYILVTTDAKLSPETAKLIEEKVTNSQGPGNFESLYINIPQSTSKDPVRVIPVGDHAIKDDLVAIKQIMESEALAMHRMQAGISGVIPRNMAGFGDLDKVSRIYLLLELPSMQQPFLEINDILAPNLQIGFETPNLG